MALRQALSYVVSGTPYLVHPQVLGSVGGRVSPSAIVPVVLISDLSGGHTVEIVNKRISRFADVDDVYQHAFAQNLVIQSSDEEVPKLFNDNLQANALNRFSEVYHSPASLNNLLPSGPYFLHGSNIHQAWRLYPDDLDAFIFAVVPDDVKAPKRYDPLNALSADGIWRSVAVPSRLYSRPTAELPLAGARVAIKDIYKLAGVKSTMMSRDYTELYGPDEESAEYVDKLRKLGAIVVGKTKMTSFASSEEPTDQWIDFHCPVNPRGDQYQSPSGSSSGAAAALAGYPWLDYSVGSDSAGSIRAPATCNGLFSIRPSFNTTSMKGVAVNSKAFDVVGQFSRTLEDLQHIVANTLDLSTKWTKFPHKILYPLDFFPHSNKRHQAMVDEIVSILETFLGTKRVEFSIAERWSQCPPEAAKGKSLKEYLAKSAFWSLCRDYDRQFVKYRNDYREKFGKEPYVGAIVNFRWGLGRSVTDEEYHQYNEELSIFRDWFDENVMSSDPESLSDAIMIMPYGSANPKYRDSPNEAPSSSHSIGEKFISPILHMPQLVLPFAQMPYESRVSNRLEYRPIATTLVGAPGSDLMLIGLAKAALDAVSWPTKISTGRLMYAVGDNVRNVHEDQSESEGHSGGYLQAQEQLRAMDSLPGDRPLL